MPLHLPWLSEGLEHQRSGRFAEAEELYNRILQSNPSEVDALHLFGLIAASRGQFEAAASLIQRAIGHRPNRADLHASLGNIFLAQDRIDEMTHSYRAALLLAYFKEIPTSFPELLVHIGQDPPTSGFVTDRSQYRSQWLQDTLLDRWIFNGMTEGVFVDIGAHDGVTLSNSYFFETVRGWRGIAIEPNPHVFAKAQANRRCTVLNCCIASEQGAAQFLKISGYAEMLSGMVAQYDPEHRRRIEQELGQFGGSAELIDVQTQTLNDISAQSGYTEITYLSIDTEGGEFSILQSIDFGRLLVHAVTVECNFDQMKSAMISLMHARDFAHVQTLGHDLVFLNYQSPFYAPFTRLRSS